MQSADISGKADTVTGATAGNVATLDATGNLTDGGVAATAIATKVTGATAGNVAGLDASGNLIDSGVAASDIASASSVSTELSSINTKLTSDSAGKLLVSTDAAGGTAWVAMTANSYGAIQ